MNAFRLPKTIKIGGRSYDINTDYRTIIYILQCYANPEYEPDEKALICLNLFYKNVNAIPTDLYGEALEKSRQFIDYSFGNNGSESSKHAPRLMDWEQDAPLFLAAINTKLGYDVRAVDYMHWWTFLGYYMDINPQCVYSTVLHIREKLLSGKKLEQYEREFYKKNKRLVDLQPKLTDNEQAEYDAWKTSVKALIGG